MKRSPKLVTTLAATAMLTLTWTSLVIGPGEVDAATVWQVFATHLRLTDVPSNVSGIADALVWDIRLPRTLLTATVGAALAAAGTVTQGLFRNPMAEPGVLGISMGAATAAVLGFTLGLDRLGLWVTPCLAGLGATVILAVLYGLARPVGGLTSLLLSGIALGALCSAATTLMLAIDTDRWDLGIKVIRWLMGSFEARSWSHLQWGLPVLAIGLAGCVWLRLDLDALALGSETAQSLGIDLRRTQLIAMATVAVLIGMSTALTGVIGFVGLIVPHIGRLLVGPSHRRLLPVATLLGAVALQTVDAASRLVPNLALPPGAITSLLGAPFFLWLLRRHGGGDT